MNEEEEIVEAEFVQVEESQGNDQVPANFSEIKPEPLDFSDPEIQSLEQSFDLDNQVREHPTKSFKCDQCGQYHDALYVSWSDLAHRLNDTFGVGQWQLVRASQPGYDEETNVVSYDGILFIRGKYAGDATGSISWNPESIMDKGDAIEAAKSSCLTRCCKVIMPGLLELWDEETSIEYYHGDVDRSSKSKNRNPSSDDREKKPCPEHPDQMLVKREQDGETWWSHQKEGGSWCNATPESEKGNETQQTGQSKGNSKQTQDSPQKGRPNQQESEEKPDLSAFEEEDGTIATSDSDRAKGGLWRAFHAQLKEVGIDDREDFKDFLWAAYDIEEEKGFSNLSPKQIRWLTENLEQLAGEYREAK